MPLDEIRALPIRDYAADSCWVLLWFTAGLVKRAASRQSTLRLVLADSRGASTRRRGSRGAGAACSMGGAKKFSVCAVEERARQTLSHTKRRLA